MSRIHVPEANNGPGNNEDQDTLNSQRLTPQPLEWLLVVTLDAPSLSAEEVKQRIEGAFLSDSDFHDHSVCSTVQRAKKFDSGELRVGVTVSSTSGCAALAKVCNNTDAILKRLEPKVTVKYWNVVKGLHLDLGEKLLQAGQRSGKACSAPPSRPIVTQGAPWFR